MLMFRCVCIVACLLLSTSPDLQGLDEAGIDEHGVFKEFLEEITTKAFNPDFCLFKVCVHVC